MTTLRLMALLASVIACEGSAFCQRILWQRTAPTRDSLLYYYMAPLGDLDRDGVMDLVTSRSYWPQYAGDIVIISGRDGHVLRSWPAPPPGGALSLATIPDIDRDGFPDVIAYRGAVGVAPFDLGLVVLYSGATGRELWRVNGTEDSYFGYAACGIGDVNRDGLPDVAVAAPGAGRNRQPRPDWTGEIHFYSGATGALIRTIAPESPDVALGWSIAAAGDVDGDGVADLVAGSPGTSLLANPPPWYVTHVEGLAGMVSLISGATGRRLWKVRGRFPEDQFGTYVGGEIDLDGDRVPDALGAAEQMDISFNQPPRPGYLFAISGRTGATIRQFNGTQPLDYLGRRPSAAGDLDGDGGDDFVFGVPAYSWRGQRWVGQLHAISGRDLSTLWVYTGSAELELGRNSFAMDDVDGDDFPEIVNLDGWPPRVTVLKGAPPGVDPIGQGCSPSGEPVPRIGVSGYATRYRPFPVHVSRVPAGRAALLVLGSSASNWNGVPLPVDLTAAGFPGCALRVAGDVIVTTTTGAAGQATVPLAIPNDPALWLAPLHLQWIVVGAEGSGVRWSMTRGMRSVMY